jgi:hypothetical protein
MLEMTTEGNVTYTRGKLVGILARAEARPRF